MQTHTMSWKLGQKTAWAGHNQTNSLSFLLQKVSSWSDNLKVLLNLLSIF